MQFLSEVLVEQLVVVVGKSFNFSRQLATTWLLIKWILKLAVRDKDPCVLGVCGCCQEQIMPL